MTLVPKPLGLVLLVFLALALVLLLLGPVRLRRCKIDRKTWVELLVGRGTAV